MKQTLAVFFGGRACEHDISIITAEQMIENVDKSRYDIIPVYIAHDGNWYTGTPLLNIDFLRKFDANAKGVEIVSLSIAPDAKGLIIEGAKGGLFAKKAQLLTFDVAVIAMHGLNGEDGTLQGMFEIADIPYTSSGVLGSAASMDKVLMKNTFRGIGLPVLDGLLIWRAEWEEDTNQTISKIENVLDYPMIIKPSNLGSSIGISMAYDRDGLYEAMEVAIRYDSRILIEKALEDFVEYNCSALGYADDVMVSVCEQPMRWEEFLTFEEKYMAGSSKTSGMENMGRILPAPISDELTQQIQQYTRQAFTEFDCRGVVRIDFTYDNTTNTLYVNEINSIPGSFAFYLWEPCGISYSQLVDKLVAYALKANKEKKRNEFAFNSNVLQSVQLGGAKGSKK